MHVPLRRLLATLLSAALWLSAARASAVDNPKDEPKGEPQSLAVGPKGRPQTLAVDIKRLGTQLDLYVAEANRKRLATALTGLGIGAALVPSGIVLLDRTDGVSRALVIGMIVGGSAQILAVPFALMPTRMDEIRADFMARPASIENKSTIRDFENEWRLAAQSSERKRMIVGTTMLVFGAINLAAGLTLLLAPEGIVGMQRKTQYLWGGILMGIGVPVTTTGVRLLLEWSLEETSWEAYRTMKSDASKLEQLDKPSNEDLSVAVLPIPGGALALATLTF